MSDEGKQTYSRIAGGNLLMCLGLENGGGVFISVSTTSEMW